MGHNKMNGSAPTLDQRISSTLASDVVDKTALVSLLEEAHEALVMVQNVVTAETPRLHDLSNTDPDASLDLISRSKLRVERLELAIPKLRDRIKAIKLYEYTQTWHSEADAVNTRSMLSAERLKHYEEFIVWLQAEFAEIDAINSELHALHARAPSGEQRRLLEPELVARGLDRYDAKHPRLRENLKLPKWDQSSEVAFPPNPMDQWNRQAALANEAMRQRMTAKYGISHSPYWASARDLAVEQETAEFAKRDAELKAKEAESKRLYEESLKHDR